MPPTSSLKAVLAEVRSKIASVGSRRLGEQNTKRSLIEPVLQALGWDTANYEEVCLEYATKGNDKPVDYALLDFREPRLFIEAKDLGANLDDSKWAGQIMMYAGLAGVRWIVLTNGNEYRIYNGHAPVPVQDKLLRAVRISEDLDGAAELLSMLSKEQLKIETIDRFWRTDFVDRHVKKALDGLLDDPNDMVLVNYVRQRTKGITDEEIRNSMRRCNVSVEVISPERLAGIPGPVSAPRSTLKELIEAQVLRPPVELFCTYKKNNLTARIQKDGTVECLGMTFQSLSLAAAKARESIIGRRDDGKLHPTNGWTFWKYKAADGQVREVDFARQTCLKSLGDDAATRSKAANAG